MDGIFSSLLGRLIDSQPRNHPTQRDVPEQTLCRVTGRHRFLHKIRRRIVAPHQRLGSRDTYHSVVVVAAQLKRPPRERIHVLERTRHRVIVRREAV
jgi:hypothetical protein